MMWNNQDL